MAARIWATAILLLAFPGCTDATMEGPAVDAEDAAIRDGQAGDTSPVQHDASTPSPSPEHDGSAPPPIPTPTPPPPDADASGPPPPSPTPPPPPTPPPSATPPGTLRKVAYFTAWGVYGRDYHVSEIPADRLTHVNYAFANVSESGECVLGDSYADIDRFYEGDSWDTGSLRGSFHQLQLLKERHPHLRTLLSVGGWTWSGRFSDVALTDESRRRFADSCVALAMGYGFDGVDIDWEYPVAGGDPGNRTRPEDRANYALLLAELRRALSSRQSADGRAEPYLLTIAAPAGPSIIPNIDVEAIHPHLDWVNLMTYDFHGGWDAITGFNAPLSPAPDDPSPGFDVTSAVESYLARGLPAGKLVVGVPFYGRGWSAVSATGDGLYQPHGPSAPMGTWEAGIFDWHDLAANYIPRMTRHWHEASQVPWLYDAATGLMISYDDPESLARKWAFVRDRGLGGVMIWELSGDDASHSLLDALR
ncbi:MAG: glycoside hydrolase family 18 protein [Deltaproteobacteria bacterium]|nr:glycoside hydrolase family 18 protein [Deltaproteobacteria bacterium]